MRTRVLLFAALREKAGGARAVEVELDGDATVEGLRQAVAAAYPALAPLLPRVAVAVNEEYVPGDHPLSPGDEIALIPPVSGG